MPRRVRGGALVGWVLVQIAAGCSEDRAPPQGTNPRAGAGAEDGGGAIERDASSPRPDGAARLPPADDEIVLPFGGHAVRYPIEVEAQPGVLDVHLSIDTSSSIAGEIDALQRDLERRVARGLRDRVPDVSFGVSRFEDFPDAPFGAPARGGRRADVPFELLTAITSDAARVQSAVASLDQPLGFGGDIAESGAEALYQIATGEGYRAHGIQLIEPFSGIAEVGGGRAGGVGFRDGALRVVLHVTDAPSHAPSDYGSQFPGTRDLKQASAALQAIGARLVAIVSTHCDPRGRRGCSHAPPSPARAELEKIALATGALGPPAADDSCPHGRDGTPVSSVGGECPLVFDVSPDGEELSSTLTDAIVALVDRVRFARVSGRASDDPLGFIRRIVPAEAAAAPGGTEPRTADLLPEGGPDGVPDSFLEVSAGVTLGFEVELQNLRLAPLDTEQRFRVRVEITGDGLVLEQRTLRVRIPAGGGLVPGPPLDAATRDPRDADAGFETDAGN